MACIAFGFLDEVGQARGHNLPGESELVLEPAALTLAPSGSQLLPVVVHLLLRIAPHEK
jgi:hypothetical protein